MKLENFRSLSEALTNSLRNHIAVSRGGALRSWVDGFKIVANETGQVGRAECTVESFCEVKCYTLFKFHLPALVGRLSQSVGWENGP